MKVPFLDLHRQYLSIKTEIDTTINKAITESAFVGGKYVKKFEEEFANLHGVKHCIGVGNGTDAIFIVLKMLGVKAGDEVITVANTWISTSSAISQTGAKPVFIDIEKEYYTIDPDQIPSKITSRTKAMIVVHLFGQMAEMDKIATICKDHNLFLIEDCAQSHLSEFKGKKGGTMGVAGTFSFYPGKTLGAYGDAGAIITNDDQLAINFRRFANLGGIVKHEHKFEGINSRLDSMQAAILSTKLSHLSLWIEKRIFNASLYSENLQGIDQLAIPQIRPNTKHTFHLYVILCERRDALREYLKEHEIETGIHYPKTLPNLEVYQYLNHSPDDFPVASAFQSGLLSLPMYPELTEEQIKHVCEKVREFYGNLG